MKEELMHYVWKTKNFDMYKLRTTENKILSIIKYGHYNLNAGPDFLEGNIKIEGQKWFGHIEMHVRSSDWIKHKHETDAAYQNVILHVVYEEDEIIYRNDGTRIPCIELKDRIPFHVMESYQKLFARTDDIPCSTELQENEKDIFYFQLNRLYIERLEAKSYPIALELEANRNNWSQTLFSSLAKGMGLPVNSEAMAALARSVPIALISKHRDQLFQIEAILFGQAGMLNGDWQDNYPKSLKKEYQFLRAKYDLQPMNGIEWKLSRMRPSSFPTLRIAFLSALYFNRKELHAFILEVEDLQELISIFDLQINPYWNTHFLWDKEAKMTIKSMGFTAKANVIVNSIVPYLFAYGQFMGEDKYIERAMKFMNELKPETNKITKRWKEHNIEVKNAMDSQALIHLYKEYCLKKRCTECAFGNRILRSISLMVKEDMESTYRSLLL